jgi:phosphoenolpyruvate synthase/pyruvate phosphate dikinase
LLEKIEFGIASMAIQGNTDDFPRVFKLLCQVAVSQGIIGEDVQDLPSLGDALEKDRENCLLGLSDLKRYFINHPPLLELLQNKGITVEEAIYTIKGMINSEMRPLLSDLLSSTEKSPEGDLLGLATCQANVVGRLRFASLDKDDAPAREGEILVIDTASPDVHKYKEASAIISAQGGIFSHAAITFSELGIPALLGCNVEALKEYNGKFIHLKLGKEPHFYPLHEETSQLIDSFSHLTLEKGAALEELPEEIKATIAGHFYHAVFQKLDAEIATSFLKYPLAIECFKGARAEIKQLTLRIHS